MPGYTLGYAYFYYICKNLCLFNKVKKVGKHVES